ncbi:ASCH domain-containing protein [Streptomyces sp. NPDC059456]|uniref:ASCH domain-containing protein n=1 Tax=Streptomyces sp. NPDC059456 TaxID=3346838 RepID=UPI003678CE33
MKELIGRWQPWHLAPPGPSRPPAASAASAAKHTDVQNTAEVLTVGINGLLQPRQSRGPGSSSVTTTSLSRAAPSLPTGPPWGPAKASRNAVEPTCVAWNDLRRLLTKGKAENVYVPSSARALDDDERELVELARRTIDAHTDAGPDEDGIHTMGAAVMAADYRMFAGVNLYHFTGGPCAELVALGAARAQGARQMRCIVAVGNHGRGVVGPCGRDRQVFVDYYPTMRVIVPTPEGPRSVLAADLMPLTQRWTPETGMNGLDPSLYQDPETAGPPIIRFNPRYLEDVRSGAKTKTTRFRDPAQLGPARLVFESDPEVVLPAEVTGMRHCLVADLTDQDAQAEGLTTATELREALKGHYPDLVETDEVDVITFQVNEKTGAA